MADGKTRPVQFEDIKLGTVLRTVDLDESGKETCHAFSDAVITKIEDEGDYKYITLCRPYLYAGKYNVSGPMMSFEQYKVFASRLLETSHSFQYRTVLTERREEPSGHAPCSFIY